MKKLVVSVSAMLLLFLGGCGDVDLPVGQDVDKSVPTETLATKSLELKNCQLELKGLNSSAEWMGVFDPQRDDLSAEAAGLQVKITGCLRCERGEPTDREARLLINGVLYDSHFDAEGTAEFQVTLPAPSSDDTYLFALWAPDAPGSRQSAFLVAVSEKPDSEPTISE